MESNPKASSNVLVVFLEKTHHVGQTMHTKQEKKKHRFLNCVLLVAYGRILWILHCQIKNIFKK